MTKRVAPVTLAILMMSVSAGAISANDAKQEFNAEQAVMMMEQHWDKVMQEDDPVKRQKLIEEHRKIMDENLDRAGVDRFHMGMMHNNGMNHHMDHLTNTIEMHHMQMDLMEQ